MPNLHNVARRRMTAVLIFVCLASSAPAGARAQSQPRGARDESRLRGVLQQKLAEFHAAGKFPGATVGVAMPDGRSFGLAVGLSDREAKTPMRESDLMLQGSVGKTYAAAVALQLVAERKLALDDKVEKYLGAEAWFARLPNAREITVRMLMNHTSGLVRYEFKEQFTKDLTADPDKVWRPEELLAYVLDTAAPFAAGKGWEYSDTNYIVLGMIVERVTKRRYYDEARRRLLGPLRLRNTVPSDGRVIKGLVQGYAGANNPFGGADAMIDGGRFRINPQFEWTGGGMASTAEDIASWAKAMYEGRAFDPKLLPEMLAGVPARLGPEAKYGLGVIIRPTVLGTAYGHSGFFPGYVTEMMYFPALKVAVAAQVNTSVPRSTPRPLSRFVVELADAVAAELGLPRPAATSAVSAATGTVNAAAGANNAATSNAATNAPRPAATDAAGRVAQQATQSARDFSELERVVNDELKASNTPGAAVAILSGGRVVFSKGFGVSSVETGAAVTREMLFRLGSTTKMFTGAAAVALARRGRLRLDAPVGDYAKGLPPRLARVTAHQLLSNSAGVADFAAPFVSHDDEALARMIRAWKDEVLFAEPGKIYSYASPGFWLAGYVLEEVGGKPYADVMEETVFRPAGMARTTLRPQTAMTYPLAVGHRAREGRAEVIRPAFNNVAMWPAGSIYSNVEDLARFVQLLLGGSPAGAEGAQAFGGPLLPVLAGAHVSMPGEPAVRYGYGLLHFEDRGVRLVMHGGFSTGYGSMIQMSPEHNFAVVVLTNRSGETLPRAVAKAKEMFLPLKAETPPAPKAAQPLSAQDAARFAGEYANGEQVWRIEQRDGRLLLTFAGTQHPLTRTAADRLAFGDSLENELVFVPGPDARFDYLFNGLYSAKRRDR